MPASRGSRSRTACTPPPQARSSTPSSAPADRSRWGRARAWPRWRPARWRPPGSPTPGDVASFVAGITLISGLLFLLLAVLRMGWIAQFLSRAVVTGFLFGAAIDVVIGELAKDHRHRRLRHRTRSRSCVPGSGRSATRTCRRSSSGSCHSSWCSGSETVAPRVPGALVLVVGGLLASYLFDLGDTWRRPRRRRPARPSVLRHPEPVADAGTTPAPRPSPRSR